MEFYGMTQQEFALKLGLSAATISSLFTGRTNPTNKHVLAIHEAFPEIDVSWLMFGEGNMLAATTPSSDGATLPQQEAGLLSTELGGATTTELHTSQAIDAPSLFVEMDAATAARGYQRGGGSTYKGKELSFGTASKIYQNVNNQERPFRKIKEIRVFFDDGTFEAFAPSTKF